MKLDVAAMRLSSRTPCQRRERQKGRPHEHAVGPRIAVDGTEFLGCLGIIEPLSHYRQPTAMGEGRTLGGEVDQETNHALRVWDGPNHCTYTSVHRSTTSYSSRPSIDAPKGSRSRAGSDGVHLEAL